MLGNGKRVNDTNTWREQRRLEILELFRAQVYGRSPGRVAAMTFALQATDTNALGGLATRKQIAIQFTGRTNGPQMNLLLYVPNHTSQPPPVFLGLNFSGNQAVCSDPGIHLGLQTRRERPSGAIVTRQPDEKTRGEDVGEWHLETILRGGYACATAWYGDLEPDFPDGWKYGVRGALGRAGANTVFAPDDWGAIAAWAWGLSRALDYLETDKSVDARRVAVIGHSRLGKAALWAAAEDERFAIAISNNSGCGGAALSKRIFGETVAQINEAFPHWFAGNFKTYNGREAALPVDQHELIALIAPRPVYVASAEKDLWADPRGEFLAAKGAGGVYELFGKAGLGVEKMPPLNQPVGDTVRYHIRSGYHDVTEYDWQQYLNFADRHFGIRQTAHASPKP
jgi:hypothetical protein